MPGNICGGICSQQVYFGFANLNFHELPQFSRPLPILVPCVPHVRFIYSTYKNDTRVHLIL